MKVGIEVKPFNFNMRNRRNELGYTQKQLAAMAHVSIEFISNVETLKMPSGHKLSYIRNALNQIAQSLEVEFDSLFPQDYLDAIQRKLLPRRKIPLIWIREVNILELDSGSKELLSLPNPEDKVMSELSKDYIKHEMENILDKLSKIEQDVIRFRYGFDNDELTLEETAKRLGLDSKEKVRQIEARALRKLRRPVNSRRFYDVIPR